MLFTSQVYVDYLRFLDGETFVATRSLASGFRRCARLDGNSAVAAGLETFLAHLEAEEGRMREHPVEPGTRPAGYVDWVYVAGEGLPLLYVSDPAVAV